MDRDDHALSDSPSPPTGRTTARNRRGLRSSRRFAVGPATAVTLAALVLSSCGISMDSTPRGMELAVSTTTTIENNEVGDQTVILYYGLEESIVPVPAQVPDDQVSTLLRQLLKPPPKDDTDSQLRSSIPSGTRLRSATQRGTVLVVDLSEDFGNVVGASRQKAIAQIVMSATQLDSIREVRFRIDGEDIQIPSPTRGDVDTVSACDFKGMLATVDQVTDADLGEEIVIPLVFRRDRLSRVCGD